MSKPNDPNANPNEGGDEGSQSASTQEQTQVVDQVTSLVSEFRQSLEAMRKAAPPVAPVVAKPAKPSADELKTKYKEAREKANQMAAEGDYAGSLEVMYETWTGIQSANQQDVTETPAFKALKTQAKRAAKSDHADVFAKYGSEVEAVMAVRPAEQQIDPDAWDKAVREVQLNHFDEILETERVNRQRAADENDGPSTIVAGGSRGRSTRGKDDVELTAEEAQFATRINFTPERYAAAKKRAMAAPREGISVAILDEAEGSPVTPGKF